MKMRAMRILYSFVKDDQGKRIKRDYLPPEPSEATERLVHILFS